MGVREEGCRVEGVSMQIWRGLGMGDWRIGVCCELIGVGVLPVRVYKNCFV